MNRTLILPPSAQPVTVAEAMFTARLDDPHWAAEVEGFIADGCKFVEHETGRKLMQQTWRYTLPDFSSAPLPENEATAVALSYRNHSGEWVTVEESAYTWAVDFQGLRLFCRQ